MIDTKRLATDAAYWDECGAPEDATHVGNRLGGQPERFFKPCWYKEGAEGFSFMYPEDGKWNPCVTGAPSHKPIITRPAAPEAEWPESGSKWEHHSGRVYAVVEITNGKTERPDQYPVTVVYQNVDNGTLWSRPLSEWARSFKPIRTPEQRQRDELESFIRESCIKSVNQGEIFRQLAEAILSRYDLEPKP